jgi:hypothetical protein
LQIISYHQILDQIGDYYKKRVKTAELQEYKLLNLPLVKFKPAIISRLQIENFKINSELGLLAYSTVAGEVVIVSTVNSERLLSLNEVMEKGQITTLKLGLANPVFDWCQEYLYLMDQVGPGLTSRRVSSSSTSRRRGSRSKSSGSGSSLP